MKANYTLNLMSCRLALPTRTWLLLLLLTYFNIFFVEAQAPVKEWDKTYGGNYTDQLQIIVPTAEGGYLLGGSSASDVGGDKSQPNRSSLDFWILMIDAEGNKLWDKRYGGNNVEVLRDMVATPDGGYLLGGDTYSGKTGDKSEPCRGSQDYWVVKIDKQGNKLWDKTFGGIKADVLTTIVPTPDGDFLLGGHSNSGKGLDKSDTNRGNPDYWVIKITKDGIKVWDKTFGGNDFDFLSDIIVTRDGGFLLGGGSSSDTSKDKSSPSFGGDQWVIKLNKDGEKEWDKTYGGYDGDGLSVMTAHPQGGYLLGGSSNSDIGGDKSENSNDDSEWGSDGWLVYISESGEKVWDKTIGGKDSDGIGNLFITSDDNILLGGVSLSDKGGDKSEENRGEEDFWMIKLSLSGDIIWDKTFGGTGVDYLSSIVPTSDGAYLLGGTSRSGAGGDKSEDGWHILADDMWVLKVREENKTIASNAGNLLAYPTLFSQRTSVEFTLPESEIYSLELYDNRGRQVRMIDQGRSEAGKTLKNEIKAGDLKDGIYYLQLQTSSKSTTLRLLLQK